MTRPTPSFTKELWLALLGGMLANRTVRAAALQRFSHEDIPDQYRKLWGAFAESCKSTANPAALEAHVAGMFMQLFALNPNGTPFSSIVAQLQESVLIDYVRCQTGLSEVWARGGNPEDVATMFEAAATRIRAMKARMNLEKPLDESKT